MKKAAAKFVNIEDIAEKVGYPTHALYGVRAVPILEEFFEKWYPWAEKRVRVDYGFILFESEEEYWKWVQCQ